MSESQSHKRAKAKAAGKSGKTETPLSHKRRLDAETKTKAVEVERSGDQKSLEKAAGRLKASNKPKKNLQVPQHHMEKAGKAMKAKGVRGTVKNMSGTKRKSV
jgi:hypothetical protein